MIFLRPCLFILTVALSAPLYAQTVDSRLNSPRTYATGAPIENEAAASLDATFEELTLSNLNVEAQSAPTNDEEPYLLEGTRIAGDYLDLFPAKFRRRARKDDTKAFAAAAIKGDGENLYIVRFVRGQRERVELFDLEGESMRHLTTLAAYDCRRNCREIESFISDVNLDGRPDVVRLYRKTDSYGNARALDRQILLMQTNGKFKKSKMKLEPTLSNTFRFDS